jgi:hypothetical protein
MHQHSSPLSSAVEVCTQEEAHRNQEVDHLGMASLEETLEV